MTTIAWDGKTLAADRQRTNGNTCQLARKLFDCGEYVWAATGMMGDMPAVRRWLEAGAKWEERPESDDTDGADAVRCSLGSEELARAPKRSRQKPAFVET
jgi:20S proteasome alpha/beta subunit